MIGPILGFFHLLMLEVGTLGRLGGWKALVFFFWVVRSILFSMKMMRSPPVSRESERRKTAVGE